MLNLCNLFTTVATVIFPNHLPHLFMTVGIAALLFYNQVDKQSNIIEHSSSKATGI